MSTATPAANPALSVIIVGAGLMGGWHARYATQIGASVVAVVDTNLGRAQAMAQHFPGASGYADLAACMQQQQADIAHICTPLDSHLPLATQAIEAGLHVIVEKPLAADPDQTEMLLTLANQRQRSVTAVHQFCWQQGVQAVAGSERLGRLLRVEFIACTAGAEALSAAAAAQVNADILPHPLALFRQFIPAAELAALNWQDSSATAGECVVNAAHSDVSLGIHISLSARPTRCELRLYGSEASATLNLFHGYAVVERGPVSRRQKLLQPAKLSAGLFGRSTLNLLRRLLAREPAYPGLKSLLRQVYQAPLPTALLNDAALVDIAAARDHIAARCSAGPAQ